MIFKFGEGKIRRSKGVSYLYGVSKVWNYSIEANGLLFGWPKQKNLAKLSALRDQMTRMDQKWNLREAPLLYYCSL
jgi:hypothetical protein